MGPHYLDRMITPNAIAVFGASERPDSVGQRVFANILAAGFKGRLYPINHKHGQVQGHTSYPDLAALAKEKGVQAIDLAVIATPAPTVPDIIRQCGEHGVGAAIVLSAGFGEAGTEGSRLQKALLEQARRFGVRIVGPNCLGLMRPRIGLNATFGHNNALPGKLALISQSGALCTAILDWAESNQVGFSAMISLGDAADVDFGEILDYLALDAETHSILMYVEGIRDARRFMSGLRVAARMKPVIVVKAGRHQAGSRAAMSHTGALVGSDDVFDAALARAGAVRAFTIEQLFAAAQILSSGARAPGKRLTIVTNGGGPGVLATDRAVELGLSLSELTPETHERLDEVLPAHWSRANPVDILGDAPPERYGAAVAACLEDPNVDGIVVMLTPQAMTRPLEAAQAVLAAAHPKGKQTRRARKPVLACWLGQRQVESAWHAFSEGGLPYFHTPEAAVEAFSYLAHYQHNQQLLMQVPGPLSRRSEPDTEGARLIIEGALGEHRKVLSAMEAKAVLAAFGVPVTPTVESHSAGEALVEAESIGFPVAMKIDSPDITHKSDIGGVRLNVTDAHTVKSVYNRLIDQARKHNPQADIKGVTIEHMHISPHGRELMVGVLRDAAFGPVIAFGAGGTTLEIVRDRAVALPPLNRFIARTLIANTRIAGMLGEFRGMPAIDMDAMENVLRRVSEMVCELPHIQELDINPLIADENGVIAVDARIRVDYYTPSTERYAHMAVYPYPAHLVRHWQLPDGTDITIRPIRPEDAEIEQAFVRRLSPQSKYFRFMQSLQELTPTMLVRFTQIDYDREMALIAVLGNGTEASSETEIGVARYTINPDGQSCEFALVVADEWHRRGIGSRLMSSLIEIARARGLKTMEGEVLSGNAEMLGLVSRLGFTVQTSADDPSVRLVQRPL
ncbi:MAG: GNAT family N-acetyltransferase [Gammaproteobacteria bacterium]